MKMKSLIVDGIGASNMKLGLNEIGSEVKYMGLELEW